jgi:hypothetical protein
VTRVWGPDPERGELAELYRRVRDEQLRDDVPEQGPRDPATTMLPAVGRHELRDDTQPVPVVTAAGVDDDLVTRTDNSLRPDDLVFDQPPQDPEWRPDADR